MSSAAAPTLEAGRDRPAAPSAEGARPSGLLATLWQWLPHGGSLPAELWARRHRGIVVLLWLHVPVILVYAFLVRHVGVAHALVEVVGVVGAAVLAMSTRLTRTVRSIAASGGLLTCSAVLVHLSGGYVELHFHFFVMLGIIALYEDWLPFALSIGYVLLHHGVIGTLFSESVYNHPDALANPWKWAGIHAFFVAAASIASIMAWRANEQSRAQAQESYRKLYEVERREREVRGQLLDQTIRLAEAERTRLAAELHDGPIQRLTALGYRLAVADLDDASSTADPSSLPAIQRDLSTEIRGLRLLMSQLRPPALDERGICAALHDLVDDFARRTSIGTRLDVSLDRRLDPEIETTLYRMLQEGLANTSRHSQARNVEVSLRESEGHVTFTMSDDGAGFDPDDAASLIEHEHFGLVGMRERVELSGGTWHLRSAPGAGTTLVAEFDVEPIAT